MDEKVICFFPIWVTTIHRWWWTCIANACAFCYLNNACETEGHALLQLEKMKIVKYQEAYRRVGVHFKPIAAEMHEWRYLKDFSMVTSEAGV